ncbi:MAG: hypothetical protein HDT30_11340 [Clostridiales bacterium]|nr:hypothetical protein [Clostridiales bacterium]
MNQRDKENFDKAIESLRQYRRYEIVDEKNRDILNDVYVDPIDGDGILRLCLKDNTTVLVGRKGTGKSTIFMRMQNELRKSKDIMTCYIDVKTIFDSAKRNYTTIRYLKTETSEEMESYSLQRQFILDFVSELINEIENNYLSIVETIKDKFHLSKVADTARKLEEIRKRIQNNNHLENLELQTLQSINLSVSDGKVLEKNNNECMGINASLSSLSGEMGCGETNLVRTSEENGRTYNRVFARIFEITHLVDEIKEIIQGLSMKRLFLILDDYSEIEQKSLSMFCDLIVNTLNNTSDDFIKLKISAYPGRVELGELDRQKIDIRYLDYYQLYVNDKRNEMESAAIDYTYRIIEKRLQKYTGHGMQYFFDTDKNEVLEFCEIIFRMSINVVRHIGLILDYAKEYSVVHGNKISITNLNEAAKRFYNERLSLFFEESKSAQMAYDERIEIFQLKDLLQSIVSREKEIKSEIRTKKYTAQIFDSERSNPFTSHFYIAKEAEATLASLELNFFVSKYNEMSNKAGKKVSIYALNYGLCLNENLRWGKPIGGEYRTYFIESPFNFNPIVTSFLKETKEIKCKKCGCIYSTEELSFLKSYGMNCMKCMSIGTVVEEKKISENYKQQIEEIERKSNLLEREQYMFMKLAILKGGVVYVRDMAVEMDVKWQKIGWITKKLEEEYYYLTKDKQNGRTRYTITELGKKSIM